MSLFCFYWQNHSPENRVWLETFYSNYKQTLADFFGLIFLRTLEQFELIVINARQIMFENLINARKWYDVDKHDGTAKEWTIVSLMIDQNSMRSMYPIRTVQFTMCIGMSQNSDAFIIIFILVDWRNRHQNEQLLKMKIQLSENHSKATKIKMERVFSFSSCARAKVVDFDFKHAHVPFSYHNYSLLIPITRIHEYGIV